MIGAQGLSAVIQLIGAAIMSRLLAPQDFGVFAMATAVSGFASIFIDLGLSTATAQSEDMDQNVSSVIFFINIIAAGAIMLLLWAAAPIAAYLMRDERVFWIIVALAPTMVISSAAAQHQALLGRRMEWGILRRTTIIAQVASLLVGAVLAWQTNASYWALVANSWAGALAGTALVWWFLPWRPSRVATWRAARKKLTFGLNLTGANIIFWVSRQFDNVLIGSRWGAAELGLYSRAYTLYMMPISMINGPIQAAVVPALSRLQSRPEDWRMFLEVVQCGVFLGSNSVAAVLIATSDSLVRVLLGPQWSESTELFHILSVSLPFVMVTNTCGMIHISLGRSYRMLRWNAVRLPLILTAFLAGLPYGAKGVALGVAALSILLDIPAIFYATRGTPMKGTSMLRRAVTSWACLVIAVTITWMMKQETGSLVLNLIIQISLCLTAYGISAALAIRFDPAMRPLRARLAKQPMLAPVRRILFGDLAA
jgi:polysaccharide transporter, PST family